MRLEWKVRSSTSLGADPKLRRGTGPRPSGDPLKQHSSGYAKDVISAEHLAAFQWTRPLFWATLPGGLKPRARTSLAAP